MSEVQGVSLPTAKKTLLSVMAVAVSAIGLAVINTPASQAQGLPLGTGGSTTELLQWASNQGEGGYTAQENKGEDANGPGTAEYRKTSGGFEGAPKGSHGVTSYVDGAGNRQPVQFTHPDDKKRPVIVFIHGGGWRGDGNQYAQGFRERVARQGFASFRIKYRLMPNGVYGTYNDVMNAIKHVRNNADTYNIDPSRIITWGDSAGGSLSVRSGASGKAGTSTAIGWSAPTNAIRAAMYGINAPLALDHSTCFDTSFTQVFGDIAELWRGQMYLFQDPQRFMNMSPQEITQFADNTFKTLNLLQESDVIGGIQSSLAEWGIDVDRLSNAYSVSRDSANRLKDATDKLDPEAADKETEVDPSNTDLQAFKDDLSVVIEGLETSEGDSKTIRAAKEKLEQIKSDLPEKPGEKGNITIAEGKQQAQEVMNILQKATESSDINDPASLIREVGEATKEDPKKASEQPPTKDDSLRAHLAMLSDEDMKSISDALGAIRAINNTFNDDPALQAQVEGLASSAEKISSALSQNSSSFNTTTNPAAGGNPQTNIVAKIAECADNIIQTSPALFADPKSPPMFLANASHETVVPPQDAYEMRDKIRSFGTRAETLILPGTNHMGYDERAVEPTLAFLRSVNHPEPINK